MEFHAFEVCKRSVVDRQARPDQGKSTQRGIDVFSDVTCVFVCDGCCQGG